LFIYFDFLEIYIRSNKRKVQIWIINRRIIKYLHELERNIKNIFIFNSSNFDIQLIVNIRELLIKDLFLLLKSDGKQLALELIEKIKQAHLSSESINLFESKKLDVENEHNSRIVSVIKSLEACQKNKRDDMERQRILIKLYKVTGTPIFLISLFIVIGLGLLYYINKTEDFSRIPANLTVIGLILAIVIFILQTRKH